VFFYHFGQAVVYDNFICFVCIYVELLAKYAEIMSCVDIALCLCA